MLHTVAQIPAGILGFVSSAGTWSLQLLSRKCPNSPRKPHYSHTRISISFMCPQCWVKSNATLMTALPINSSFLKCPFFPKGSTSNESTQENPFPELPSAPLKHHSTGRIWEMQFHESFFFYQQIHKFLSLRISLGEFSRLEAGLVLWCKKVGKHQGNATAGTGTRKILSEGDPSGRRCEQGGFWLLSAMEK